MNDRLGIDAEFGATDWMKGLRRTEKGAIVGNENNLVRALKACPETAGAIAADTRQDCLVALRNGPWGQAGRWSSTMTSCLAVYFQELGIPARSEKLDEALAVIGDNNRIDPLCAYLDSQSWDRDQRMDTWLPRYAGAEGTEINCIIGARFLLGMVARAYEPGCKVDHCLALEGSQGLRKSQLVRVLGGDYTAEDLPDFHSRDAQQIAGSHWVIEIPDLGALGKSSVEKFKAFATTVSDVYVPKYQRYPVSRQRWCVFILTHNATGAGWLVDSTGNRRIWPVTVGEIDIDALRRDRDQLFAEAVHRYRAGGASGRWWPQTPREVAMLAELQDAQMDEDAWTSAVVTWLKYRASSSEWLTTSEILTHALYLEPRDIGRGEATRVGKIMKALGWKRKQLRVDGKQQWGYAAPVTTATTTDEHEEPPYEW